MLPCKVNLLKRKNVDDELCEFYGKEETVLHCLRDCILPSMVWERFDDLEAAGDRVVSMVDWADGIRRMLDVDKQGLWACLLSKIWRARNAQIFKGRLMDPAEIIERSVSYFSEYADASRIGKMQGKAMGSVVGGWKKPNEGWISICCDASVKEGESGIGIVGRDFKGDVVFVGSKKFSKGMEVEWAEAEAIRWRLLVAESLEINRVVVQLDCLALIRNFQSSELPLTSLGRLIGIIVEYCYIF